MNTRDRLIDLMSENGLERREVAELVAVDLITVERWLLPREADHREDVPEMAVQLLEYKLKDPERS